VYDFHITVVCKGPPPQVETPAQVVSAPNKAAALDCIVFTQLHYNVTWSRAPLEALTAPETGKYGTGRLK
jgi:hypothetical protein